MKYIIKSIILIFFFLAAGCGGAPNNKDIVGVYKAPNSVNSFTFSHIEGQSYGLLMTNNETENEAHKKIYLTGTYNEKERILNLPNITLQFTEDFKKFRRLGINPKGDPYIYRQ